MNSKSKYKWKFCSCSLAIAGILLIAQSTLASTFIHKDDLMTPILFSNTKPQCIGRYLIEVPESFNDILKNMVFIDDFKIESQRLYRPGFEQRIKLREQELHDSTNKPGNDSIDAPFLKEVIRLPDGKGVIFDHNWSGKPDSYRQLEAHVYSGMTAFMITAKIHDYSDPKNRERKAMYLSLGFTEAQSNNKPSTLLAMRSLISRLSGRKDDEIPVDKGICIPDGFIKDDEGKHQEKISFTYETDDFYFSMGTDNSYVGSNSTLLSRGEAIEEEQAEAHFHTVKNGELQPGGIPAQEWLSAGMQRSNHIKGLFPMYDFTLNANESIASPTKPWIDVGLSNTDKLSQYNEAQMVEIWDKLVSTIRYRPNAY